MTKDVTHLYASVDMGDDWAFGRQLALGKYMVPGHVRVEDGAIEWTLHTDDPARQQLVQDGRINEAVRWSRPTRGLLDRFIKLRLDDPSSIVRFVDSWGVLIPGDETQLNETTGFESLGLWKALQADLVTLIEASSEPALDEGMKLNLGRIVKDGKSKWLGLEIGGTRPFDGYPAEPRRLLHRRSGTFGTARVATMYVDAMLAARRPVVVFHEQVGMRVQMTGLSAALALQLGDVLLGRTDRDQAAGKTIAFCASCGGPITLRRAPSPGRPSWCKERQCQNEAARRRKARQRAKA